MGQHFYREQEVFRETILRCDEYVRKYLGWSLRDNFSKGFPDPQQYRDEERIQPAMTACNCHERRLTLARSSAGGGCWT